MIASHFRHSLQKSVLVWRPAMAKTTGTWRAFSNKKQYDDKSDRDLHEAYNKGFTRFKSACALLRTQEGWDKLKSFVEARGDGAGVLTTFAIFTQLEHPLFLKYNFDFKDFMTGAKHAFETLTGEVLHSEAFRDRVRDVLGDSGKSAKEEYTKNCNNEDHYETGCSEKVVAGSVAEKETATMKLLASVCTENGFLDFFKIACEEEMQTRNKFVITNEKLDRISVFQALIRVEDSDSYSGGDGKAVGKDKEAGHTSESSRCTNISSVYADIAVVFLTTCDIQLERGVVSDDETHQVRRLCLWTFSSELGRANRPAELEWRVSEVFHTYAGKIVARAAQ